MNNSTEPNPNAKLTINQAKVLRPLSSYKLIVFDMDSTLINIECIDEIAALIDKKAAVAAITEATMRGEITDFQQSLRQRVALLAGTPVAALQTILEQRLQLNPGAEQLVQHCRQAGLKVMLLSGGFLFFARWVQQLLQIDFIRANDLEISQGKLSGKLVPQSWGEICDGAEKRNALLQMAAFLDIGAEQCIAVGDGSNDLPMMATAGLSVAYNAKPIVRQQADISIEQLGLDAFLQVLPKD